MIYSRPMQIYFGLHGQETVSELSALDPRESGLNLTELFLDYQTLPKGAFPAAVRVGSESVGE